MGASFVFVKIPGSAVSLQFSAPVGGPSATLQAEAVGLLYLLWRAKSHCVRAIPLLVFIDCLVLLQILQKWDRSDFWPDPRDIITSTSFSLSRKLAGTSPMKRPIEASQG